MVNDTDAFVEDAFERQNSRDLEVVGDDLARPARDEEGAGEFALPGTPLPVCRWPGCNTRSLNLCTWHRQWQDEVDALGIW